MHRYIIETLEELVPKRTNIKKFREDKDFLFVRGKKKKILVLNPTAREIYGLCDGKTVGQIIKVMSESYPNINMEKLSLDTLRFLRSMEISELIVMR
jgi:hypothetical protein